MVEEIFPRYCIYRSQEQEIYFNKVANRFGVDREGILGLDELYGMFKRMPEHEGPYLMSLALEGLADQNYSESVVEHNPMTKSLDDRTQAFAKIIKINLQP